MTLRNGLLAVMGGLLSLTSANGAALTWSDGHSNWDFTTDAWNASTVKWEDDNDAIFPAAASHVVTLVDDISANSLQFDDPGYEITAIGTFTLTLGGQIILG